jgi:hypothetical protein
MHGPRTCRRHQADTILVFAAARAFNLRNPSNRHFHGLMKDGPDALRQGRKIDRPIAVLVLGHISDLDMVKIDLHDLEVLERNEILQFELGRNRP